MTESSDPNAKRLKLNESNKPKRRLGSFWKSNQEIQALSIRLAAQKQEPETVPLPPQNVEEDLPSSIRKDSDEIVVVHDNVTNACAVLPHPRHICGRYPFDTEPHKSYCDKCYCYVCQIPASECKMWENSHCDADDSLLWHQAREQKKMTIQGSDSDVIELLDDSDEETNTDPWGHIDSNRHSITENSKELDQRSEDDPFQHHFEEEMKDDNEEDMVGQKPRKDARITEVLAHNIRVIDNEMNAKISTLLRKNQLEIDKMSGDIPQLNLHNSFFVEGVKIGWPYPVIMPPQRQMALHLTKAFKNSRHCVIESPTGTGKSAAILCSALAWQRYHAKTSPSKEVVKIIYCSRTHSQVGQMVASLRKTPYRPRMAILGSRDRLCIHKKLRPRSKVVGEETVKKTFDNINIGCQIRTQNVEAYRKSRLKRLPIEYNDDSPPTHHPGDDGEKQNDNEDEDEEGGEWMESEKFQTCPHYRQLTNTNIARKIHSMFVPDKQRVNCCSHGGEKTKFGTHDIEDLVKTGMNPNIRSGISLHRDSSEDSFGFTIHQSKSRQEPISISAILHDGVAEKEGTLSVGDVLVAVNGVDVSRGHTILSVSDRIRKSKNPLLLDVYSKESERTDLDIDEYSEDSACPYYISKVLSKSADLVFCPYNYILDPDIRSAMELDVENTIVILDEAHNVEDALRSLGSDKFGEIELLKMLALLDFYAEKWQPRNQRLNWGRRNMQDEDESLQERIPEICHSLLLFLEPIILSMRDHKEKFEKDQIQFGISKAIEEYERFKSPDDKEFEVRYFGPTGSGDGKKPIGCQRFFESINTTIEHITVTVENISDFMKFMNTKRGNPRADERRKLADRVCKLITMLCNAFKSPEHYYISTAVSANGNLDFATGKGDGASNRFRKYPKPIPMVPKEDVHRPRMCRHPRCNEDERGTTSHEILLDGSTPRWEIQLTINVLTPAILMAPILRDTRSVILASGTLAPLDSLCAELNLLPPSSKDSPVLSTQHNVDISEMVTSINPLSATTGRLQVQPRPLEANHVVNLSKQLLAVSVGHFLDGSQLSVKMSNYSRPGFHDKLGSAIATIVEGIPSGGVLIFVPSFSFLRKCVSNWEFNGTWDRLMASKGEIVVEPNGQAAFEKARDRYNTTIERTKQCILLAVFRGKMSEGVSFNDHYARGVICVGVPLPNTYDRSISAKMAYNNEQRRFNNKQVLGGNEWYTQQAYRALAQAIGRCIRHSADYGTIILLDSRHCDDGHVYYESGTAEAHKNLPKWMRHAVKTLRPDNQMHGRNDLLGGWKGLQSSLKKFFEDAGQHSLEVTQKQKNDFELSQERASQSKALEFDQETGRWSSPDF